MTGLKLADVLALDERPVVSVDVPEWGGTVYLTVMSTHDLDRIQARYLKAQEDPEQAAGLTAAYVAACWCDENGKRQAITTADVKKLGDQSPKVLRRLMDAAQKLHDDDEEDAEKN